MSLTNTFNMIKLPGHIYDVIALIFRHHPSKSKHGDDIKLFMVIQVVFHLFLSIIVVYCIHLIGFILNYFP